MQVLELFLESVWTEVAVLGYILRSPIRKMGLY